MQRRSFIKTLSAAGWLVALPTQLLAAARAALPRTLQRVRPTDADWPSTAEWSTLNRSVRGNLIAVQALFADCAVQASAPLCLQTTQQIGNPFFIGDQPGGTQVSGWLGAWTPAPSAYAVKAHGTTDMVAAVNFAREHRLRLVVKGAGHSYQGTSNAADSLLLWTRAMRQVTLHDAFVAAGSSAETAPVQAVTAEAGAVWIDLYHAVTTLAGRYVQGGGCADVGVAGLIQSGGFGSLSKAFGTASSSLLEAEIVTADGIARTVNANLEPDLFWAIKGGGGGCWGVITKVTLRTHPLPQFFGSVWGKIKAQSDDAMQRLLARFVAFYAANLCNPHWGEQVAIDTDNTLDLSMMCQDLEAHQIAAVWQPFFDWIRAAPDDYGLLESLGSRARVSRNWWVVDGNRAMRPDTRPGAQPWHGWWNGDQGQVGAFLHGFDSLWLPLALLAPASQARLCAALFAGSRHQKVSLHFNKGLAGAPTAAIDAARQTAMNPAVCDAFALAIIATGSAPAYPGQPRQPLAPDAAQRNAQAVKLAAAALRNIVPDAGSYVSESDYFNTDWQQAFWGANYARLRQVKARYDPDGLFFVHHGVGSELWSADGFARVSA